MSPRPSRARSPVAGSAAGVGALFVLVMVTAAPTPAASLVVPACAAIGASYPALMDPNSTASFFPSIPPIANTSGAPPGAGSTAGGGNGTGQPPPPPPFFPSINVTDGEVAQLFAQVCETAAFQSAFNSTGVQNFSLGGSFNARNGTAFIGYSFVWVAGCPPGAWVAYGLCSFEESWLANVTSKVITGPTVTVMPAVSSYGPGGSTAPPRVPSASFGAGPANVPVALLLWAVGAVAVAVVLLRERQVRVGPPPFQ